MTIRQWFYDRVVVNWKSTLSGFLTATVVTLGYFTAIPSTVLQSHGVSQNTIFWGAVVNGLAIVWLGLIKKDAKQ